MELIIQILSSNLLTNILLLFFIVLFISHGSSIFERINKQTTTMTHIDEILFVISLQHASENEKKNEILVDYEKELQKRATVKKMFNPK